MVTDSKIMELEERKWSSDHKIIKVTILGMPIIRDLSKRIWQKPTYDTKGLEGKRQQMLQQWAKTEVKGRTALDMLNKNI